jgi:two-component system, chemotaxis family, sensor kinase CheA
MEAIDEIVAEFLVESHENLDQLDHDLLALEQDPTSRDLLGSVFRTIHTIKGTSGFLAFNRLEQLTHVGENLLSRLRDARILLSEERTSALLSMVDAVRGLLAEIERTGVEGEADHTELTERLGRLLEDAEETAPDRPSPAAAAPLIPLQPSAPEAHTPPDATAPITPTEPVSQDDLDNAAFDDAAFDDAAFDDAAIDDERTPGYVPGSQSASLLGEILVENGSASPAAVAAALQAQDGGRRSVVDSSVRVDVELLDTLMRMVGELVLARNHLVSKLEDQKDTALARSAQRLSLVTSELQEQVMKTRMQPVDTVWSKLPRVVRDLSHQCGRQVRLELEGRETELDRSVLEAIKDPLTHLVRNAIDHGIETPADRVAAGKPEEGLLTLRAYHEAGQVHLEIIDDGSGIDPGVIAAKALERELVTTAQLERMTAQEIIRLIFLPGFSTADAVTNVSGRGVGMDVVKTRIEGIGGSVDVTSTKGSGSTFRLTIPLTLAIIPALTIGCAGRRYAVPQVSVLELVRLSGEHARGGIEHISGAPVYRLRGTLLPLVRLDEQLGLVPTGSLPAGSDDGTLEEGRGGFIVVLQAEQQQFGLVVDDVLDTQEIVVKPLGRHLKGLGFYAGATIVGDGSVVLILDAAPLARRANVRTLVAPTATQTLQKVEEPMEPMLVVQVSGDRQAAIPLTMVTRLEEIKNSTIERVGGREVVQYRGHIMPMVRLATLLGAYGDGTDADPEGSVQLVVYTLGGHSVGFAVDRILDIATERSGSRSDIDDHALLGSVVVGDRVVELLDVRQAVLAADPNFFDKLAATRSGQPSHDQEALV